MFVHPEVTSPLSTQKKKGSCFHLFPISIPSLPYFKNQCKQPTRSLLSTAYLRSCACHKWEILTPGKVISGLIRVDAQWDAYHQTLNWKSYTKAVSWPISPCPIHSVTWECFKWCPSSNHPSLQLFSPSSNSQTPEFSSLTLMGIIETKGTQILQAGWYCLQDIGALWWQSCWQPQRGRTRKQTMEVHWGRQLWWTAMG